ncbi:dihydrodipicolinate synthase family protein [Aspergillus melleus]|uniref:dihydrodipicolinate synthase family protein n=1 Tax=Aspergillus melleus TaxID=138277 RepID=UPI001E8E3A96|nr:uncharacterized protein LDX57_007159 [Aspergillus melleus]KAH8429497.1 hypothetical protein LDX57_007159 [Aspergillus melleus]
MSLTGLSSFFSEVADASPLPVLIYNYPDVTGGLNITLDTIIEMGKKHKNIVRVKLTCGDVGKLHRIQPSFPPGEFAGLDDESDFLLLVLVIGTHGAITCDLWSLQRSLDNSTRVNLLRRKGFKRSSVMRMTHSWGSGRWESRQRWRIILHLEAGVVGDL